MSLLAVLAAPFTSALPASKADRDAQRARDLSATASAEAQELERLERLQVEAREARRARDAEIEAAHAARDRELADRLAVDALEQLCPRMAEWQSAQSRPIVKLIVAQIRDLEARSQKELGQPLRRLVPALGFAKTLTEERPELVSLFSDESFFIGTFGLSAQVVDANDRVLGASLRGDVVAAEYALRDLEAAFSSRLVGDVPEPTERQSAKWSALLVSGRDVDFTARVAEQRESYRVEDVSSLEAEQAAGADEAADEQYELETERLARFASRAYQNDTTHFDRLAAEQNAPRAVQTPETELQ